MQWFSDCDPSIMASQVSGSEVKPFFKMPP